MYKVNVKDFNGNPTERNVLFTNRDSVRDFVLSYIEAANELGRYVSFSETGNECPIDWWEVVFTIYHGDNICIVNGRIKNWNL